MASSPHPQDVNGREAVALACSGGERVRMHTSECVSASSVLAGGSSPERLCYASLHSRSAPVPSTQHGERIPPSSLSGSVWNTSGDAASIAARLAEGTRRAQRSAGVSLGLATMGGLQPCGQSRTESTGIHHGTSHTL